MKRKPLSSTVFIFFLFLFFSRSVSLSSQETTRNVLVLHSYHQGLEWTDGISKGIESVLQKQDDQIDIYYEYLDTKRNPGEEYFQRLTEFEMRKKQLGEINFEVIITSDNDALRFVTEYGKELFHGTPVIFCGVNNFTPALLGNRKNITGITERVDYLSTLNIMKDLHPERSKVLIVLDRTSTGKAIKTEFDRIIPLFEGELDFEYFQDFKLDEVPLKIKSLDKKTMIYILTMNKDSNDVFISYANAIRIIHEVSTVPIYGSWDFFYGKGIVGGMITSGFYQGEQAGIMALRVLKGEPAGDLPIIYDGTNRYMFDYRELSRFDIDKSLLPADSYIINRPDSWLKQNQIRIILAILLVLILVLIVLSIHLRRKKNEALSEVKNLSVLLPICSNCKKIRDDQGYWNQIETYISRHSDMDFSHGLCPECSDKLYPEYRKRKKKDSKT